MLVRRLEREGMECERVDSTWRGWPVGSESRLHAVEVWTSGM